MLPSTSTEQEVGRLFPPQLPGLLLSQRSLQGYHAGRAPRTHQSLRPGRHERASNELPPLVAGPVRKTPTAAGRNSAPAGDAAPPSNTRHNSLVINFKRAANFGAGLGIGIGGGYLGPLRAHAITLWPFPGRKRVHKQPEVQPTILIMMSLTGGGHKASADAIKAALQRLYGDRYNILIVDMWKQHTPYPFCNIPDTYSFMVRHSMLWRLSYSLMQPRWFHIPYFAAAHAYCARMLNEAFNKYQPDMVVSVHPLMQHIPLRVLKTRVRKGLQAPVSFATVVTDFTTCHNTWFHKDVTKCFVPTSFTAALAARNGLSEEQIVQHGLPIRPAFSDPLPPRHKLRKQLGMEVDVPAILLVGGGEGMGKLEATVDELAARLGPSAQVVVICGRNKRLYADLAAKNDAYAMRVIPLGFVENIHDWMQACDCIITKAGPGTIAEALICGLPILLNGNVPCQEEGNIPYVVDNGVGAFERNPARIAEIIAGWLGPQREEFREMARRAKALGKPEAVFRIAKDLAALADQHLLQLQAAGPKRQQIVAATVV